MNINGVISTVIKYLDLKEIEYKSGRTRKGFNAWMAIINGRIKIKIKCQVYQ